MDKSYYEEKTIKSDTIYDGRILKLRVDNVELPNKMYSKREIVEHPRGVAMVPLIGEDIILVKQYRKAIEDFIYEIPAGLVEINENIQETAIRELQEEIGYKPNKIELISEAYASPGFTDEKISIFLATDLEESKLDLDDTEFLEVERMPLQKAYDMIENFEIYDAKTIIGILFAMRRLGK